MLGFALAVRVPVVNTVPLAVSEEFAAFVQVEPAADPVKSPRIVTLPLLVTVTAAVIEKLVWIVRTLPAVTLCATAVVMLPAIVPLFPATVVALTLRVVVKVPASVPSTVRLPATTTFPASVAVTPELTLRWPKVIAAVGVMLALAVKVALVVAMKVSAVVVAVRLPPKLTFELATVENEGVFAEPNDSPPLRFIVPVLVTESVPELSVRALLKVMLPMLTVITSVAAVVLAV